MELLTYILSIIAVYAGMFAGYFLSINTFEEFHELRTYFSYLKIFFLPITILLTIILIGESSASTYLAASMLIILTIVIYFIRKRAIALNKNLALIEDICIMLICAGILYIALSSSNSLLFIIPGLIFVYAMVYATIDADVFFHTKKLRAADSIKKHGIKSGLFLLLMKKYLIAVIISCLIYIVIVSF